MDDVPPAIADYALLGDTRSTALVATEGSIDWCVFGRFDANPVFAACLGHERGGRWTIRPRGEATATRKYRGASMVLETTWRTDRGVARVTDALVLERLGSPGAGRLVRWIEILEGSVEMTVRMTPRFDFGMTLPRTRPVGKRLRIFGGSDSLALESSMRLERVEAGVLEGRQTLHAGEHAYQVLTNLAPWKPCPDALGTEAVRDALEATVEAWDGWAACLELPERYHGAVQRSALVLKALIDGRTGAMVAAPTTSLPEAPRGGRTWDYRYTWIRDAAFVINTLRHIKCQAESHHFFEWLEHTTAGRVEDLQILYGVGGERILPEVALDSLPGHQGAGPIRVGNGAANQAQHDVYGHVLDAAWGFQQAGGDIDDDLWQFLSALTTTASERWEHPDCGIWEVRGYPQHFVHSKVMVWVAVDRAVKLARALGRPADPRWAATAEAIHRRVLTDGVNARGELMRAFGQDEPDAALLRIPLVGFLPPNDARVEATVRRIERELDRYPLVARYNAPDGLEGHEAAFVLTGLWLVQVLTAQGRRAEARKRFEAILTLGNDVGLFAEEVDPETGRHWGNFPQAYSHVGVINAALVLTQNTDPDMESWHE